ncbi:MAG TPA: Asp-tRNA(Asn)/Glu-tRNA(Gln) amidotransferase subunit GatC [Myxococcales bacterium]|nr:Asp-tRNA(Asn)/Glu-tRNA(Gln) amidotransferase subunit GatC [Myxococcales bacterium]
MALTVEQVRHVAALARLKLTPEEEQRFTAQLSAILDHMAELQALDTSGVEPTSHAALEEPRLRPDEVQPSLDPEQGLENAPRRSGTSFAVPRVIE